MAAQVRSGNFRLVFLDSDGTLHCWLAVVVRSETGVVYGNQCEGVATKQRLVEGYLVLLDGWKYDVDGGMIDLTPLTEAFHKVARALSAASELVGRWSLRARQALQIFLCQHSA